MITSIEYYYVHSSERFHTFRRMFYNMPRLFSNILWIVWEYSPKCLRTFPGVFGDISQNVWRHSPECLRTFSGIFDDIPRNVCRHSPECLRTFPGIFGDIPQNVWRHSPECLATFPGIWYSPHSPCSPHSVPHSYIPGFIHNLIHIYDVTIIDATGV